MAEDNVTLRVRNVSKRFGDFSAVEDLSFDVRAGRVFGFLGPNGAGKTTTIRMIVGITVPDEGSIELFGQKISPALQDRIGYLPEERGLYKKMKIADQLRYFAALKGVSAADADKKIDFWLDRMNLGDKPPKLLGTFVIAREQDHAADLRVQEHLALVRFERDPVEIDHHRPERHDAGSNSAIDSTCDVCGNMSMIPAATSR